MGGVIISMLALALCHNDAYLYRTVLPLCFVLILSPIHFIQKGWVKYIASYSMLIYCLHIPVSRFTSKVPALMGFSSPALSLIVATTLTIVVIVALGDILKRSERLWRTISGGR